MTASAIPAAITSLLGLCTKVAQSVPGQVQVADGTPVSYAANTYVIIEGASGGNAPWEATRFSQLESFVVHGIVRAWQGNADASTCRTTAFAVLDALKVEMLAALDAGPLDFNGSASWRLEVNDIAQGLTSEGGWACEASFSVIVANCYLEAS